MKLCMFTPKDLELERGWPGKIVGDGIVQVAAQTLQAFFTGGGTAREHAGFRLADCDLLAPVMYPPAVRVFTPFERAEEPLFSFRSPFPVLGPDTELPYPEGVEELDYGLALAAMIGAEGAIGGLTIANDWTAREAARAERAAGFGPGRSSNFGLSLGPVLVTPDELAETRLVARVNGEDRCGADTRELVHRWPALVESAARNTTLRPGDLLLARLTGGAGPPLQRGDIVELEAEGIGVLRNRVA
jgi:2-keto-4-pentenoate hydratase/2-oxohepta-3-ene-1,7-dioic acid hydratase in catechol pathway